MRNSMRTPKSQLSHHETIADLSGSDNNNVSMFDVYVSADEGLQLTDSECVTSTKVNKLCGIVQNKVITTTQVLVQRQRKTIVIQNSNDQRLYIRSVFQGKLQK